MHFIASLLRSRYVVWATTSDDYIYTVYVSAYGILSTSNLLIKGLYTGIYIFIHVCICMYINTHALYKYIYTDQIAYISTCTTQLILLY